MKNLGIWHLFKVKEGECGIITSLIHLDQTMDQTKKKYGIALIIAFAIFLSILTIATIVLASGGGFSSPLSIALFVLAVVSALPIYIIVFLAWTRGTYSVSGVNLVSGDKFQIEGFYWRPLVYKIKDVKDDGEYLIISPLKRLHFRVKKAELDEDTLSKLNSLIKER